MTIPVRGYRSAMLGLVGLALAGCGNDPSVQSSRSGLAAAANVFLGRGGASETTVGIEQRAAQALSATSEPVIVLTTNDGQSGLMLKIGENRGYTHFASSERQVLTLQHGVIAASRGLGNDLMSADIGPSLALIRARKPGQAIRKMRYLDGEDRTFTYQFSCSVSVGSKERFQSGLINAPVTSVTETCRAGDRSFTNVYKVDGTGYVVGSSQWLAPLHGSVSISQLRK